ncbi:MAG: site-specific DNA-methyltransferase [Roseburia sp.]|nr:site-specific DNA-methyltransferase [Roseburia sp.]
MIRQGDLRYAKSGEKTVDDVITLYVNKLDEIIDDIDSNSPTILSPVKCLNDDARLINEHNLVDCVITSPPYLNGTNYIRNTKLELKLFDYIQTEDDLPLFHSKGIIAGINNVSKRNAITSYPSCIQCYLDKLIPVAYDSRIPTMVKGYFHDMDIVIKKLSNLIKDGGKFIMDIGDSQFAGVHIPTHKILTQICASYGFELYDEEILRERRSKNGMVLTQRLLKFTIHKSTHNIKNFEKEAKTFIEEKPYKQGLYSGRNWGHQLHSLCSYHGKLKPAIAHFLVRNFTEPNDIVLDPLGGVGTIPLEACLQGRIGISNDLSEMAYVVAKAKLEMPVKQDVYNSLNELNDYIETHKNSAPIQQLIDKYSTFGFNGKLNEYYHCDTLKEILCAREYYIHTIKNLTPAQAMCMSCLLHVLHGNRPYALSRNSHPLTPYAPTGEYVYKNLVEHVRAKIDLTYKDAVDLKNYVRGKSILGDFSQISLNDIKVDAIICSPPFADSIRFYMQNWLRLWFCGWEQEDFKNADMKFLDTQQKNNFDVYKAFFDMCYRLLKPNGKVILHLGKTDKYDMSKELTLRSSEKFNVVFAGEEDVSDIEKHGIKDKGKTIKHQYLFLSKKGD